MNFQVARSRLIPRVIVLGFADSCMFRFRFCKLIEVQDPSTLKEPSCWLTQLSTHILDSVVIS
jgi:hypothetical protein